MTLVTDYTDLAALKLHLGRPSGNTADDTELSACITAASRAIDATCNRVFGQAASASARYYTWNGETYDASPAILIDDVATTTDLAVTVDTGLDYTYSTTLTLNTDFDLAPWNAAGDLVPWNMIVLRSPSPVILPTRARSVSVTGQWGWAAVPDLVSQACLIQATRWFMRRDAWAGVAGGPEAPYAVRLFDKLDPDVAMMLVPVTRFWGAV